MRPGGSGSPGITSSSPVKNTATRRRRYTVSSPTPTEAASPRSCGRRRVPGASTVCPASTSTPARRTHAPAAGFSLIVTLSPAGAARFLHHDRVRARRHRRAGEDARGGAGLERRADVARPRCAGSRAAWSAPPARRACARRSRPSASCPSAARRIGRHDAGGEDAAARLQRRHGLDVGDRVGAREHLRERLFNGEHRTDRSAWRRRGGNRGHQSQALHDEFDDSIGVVEIEDGQRTVEREIGSDRDDVGVLRIDRRVGHRSSAAPRCGGSGLRS